MKKDQHQPDGVAFADVIISKGVLFSDTLGADGVLFADTIVAHGVQCLDTIVPNSLTKRYGMMDVAQRDTLATHDLVKHEAIAADDLTKREVTQKLAPTPIMRYGSPQDLRNILHRRPSRARKTGFFAPVIRLSDSDLRHFYGRDGGQYNTRKGNKPRRSVSVSNIPVARVLRAV